MFAQVACLACGKPFQVAKGKLGQTVPCPWCFQPTAAVPVAVEVNPLPAEGATAPIPTARRPRLVFFLAYAVVLFLLAVGVFVGLRYQAGAVPDFVIAEFVAPDGSCRSVLPGAVREVPIAEADGGMLTGGKRFASSSWATRIVGGIGWFDLSAADVKLIRPEDLFDRVRAVRAKALGGVEVEKQGVVRVDAHLGREVQFQNANERYAERYVFVATGSHPRVYWVSLGGPNFDPESAIALRVLGSLRVTE